MQGPEGHLPEVGRNNPEDSLGHCLKKMVKKTKQKTTGKEKEKETLPLEATQFFCYSLMSNLSRKEHVLHYRIVIALFYHEKRRF